MTIVIVVVQLVIAGLLAGVIFRAYRIMAARDRNVGLITAAGILVRAVVGQILFWISFLHLPIGRSMQMGNGLWWFGGDSIMYFNGAIHAAQKGLPGLLAVDRTGPSPFYIQMLAVAVVLLGAVTSIALLINLAAYVGTCFIASSLHPEPSKTVTGAIAAISLLPSSILWSLQPLKEIVFMFLLAALFGLAALWRRFASDGARLVQLAITSVALSLVMYAISGVRWYFACALLVALFPFLFGVAVRTKAFRAAIMAVVTFGLSTYAFFAGTGPYLAPIRDALLSPTGGMSAPMRALGFADTLRSGFDRTAANTVIRLGQTLASSPDVAKIRVEQRPAIAATNTTPPVLPIVDPPAPQTKAPVAQAVKSPRPAKPEERLPVKTIATGRDLVPAVDKPPSVPLTTTDSARAAEPPVTAAQAAEPRVQPVIAAPVTQSPTVAPVSVPPPVPQKTLPVASVPAPQTTTTTPAAAPQSAEVTPIVRPQKVDAIPPAAAQPVVTSEAKTIRRRASSERKALPAAVPPPAAATIEPVRKAEIPPVPTTTSPTPHSERAPAVQPLPADGADQSDIVLPGSRGLRLLAGTIAVLVPRTVAQKTGLIDIRGGRGMWVFADVDTIAFDFIVVAACFSLFVAFKRRALIAPLVFFAIACAVLTAVPIIYTVANFGTLFRHRTTIALTLALIPVAVAAETGRSRDEMEPPSESPA